LLEQNHLEPHQVAELVRQQFPQVAASSVRYLGEGCDSSAFEVDSCWVFRFPKREDVEQQLLLERRVLPVLAERSPIPLPRFCFHGHPNQAFPRHFVGYPKLPGIPGIRLDPETVPFRKWAPLIARFLSWLHSFPVNYATELGVVARAVPPLIEEVRADALDDFDRLNQVAPAAPLAEWRAYLLAGPSGSERVSSTAVLVHGDFAAEHLLCEPVAGTLTGIIDWSELALSERLVDFAGLVHWGGVEFIAEVRTSYQGPLEESELDQARFLAACRAVADVAFGLDTAQREYVDAGLRALSLCVDR
jgi:aminoglycoside phosphotransferase (APT) family kinase protein